MNIKSAVGVIYGILLVSAFGGTRPAYAAPPTNACSLLTQAQVRAVLGVSVDPGKNGPYDCEWSQANSTFGKKVLVEIVVPIGSLTPAARFNAMKMPLPVRGLTKTPVTGVGDDAVYVTSNSTVLDVRKGGFVFTVHVSGFPIDQTKAKEKQLALDVLAKL